VEDVACELIADAPDDVLEELVALALELDERITLSHRAQADAFAQVIHLVEVVAPRRVEDVQHHETLRLAHHLRAEVRFLLRVRLVHIAQDELAQLVWLSVVG
jgi:hypothetical protein